MTLSAHDVWKWRWKYTVPSVALLIDSVKTVYSTTLVQKIFTTDKFSRVLTEFTLRLYFSEFD